MNEADTERDRADGREGGPYRVRLPGFLVDDVDDEVGLGDVITRATSRAGIRPCGGCAQRAAALNRWLVFTRAGRR
jgi:hypothetical protein